MSQQDFLIIRQVAPRETCETAMKELIGLEPKFETKGLLEYRPTKSCGDIATLAMKAYDRHIPDYKIGVKPVTVNVAKLRKTDSDRITGAPGVLYIVVALTRLEKASGWYSFLREEKEAEEGGNELDIGDAILWRGECVGKPGDGEGGLMLVIKLRGD